MSMFVVDEFCRRWALRLPGETLLALVFVSCVDHGPWETTRELIELGASKNDTLRWMWETAMRGHRCVTSQEVVERFLAEGSSGALCFAAWLSMADTDASCALLERSIALDPGNLLAVATLAECRFRFADASTNVANRAMHEKCVSVFVSAFRLGSIHHHALGVPRNMDEGERLYRLAPFHPFAQYWLARLLDETGRVEESYLWMGRCAEAFNRTAFHELVIMTRRLAKREDVCNDLVLLCAGRAMVMRLDYQPLPDGNCILAGKEVEDRDGLLRRAVDCFR
jgi:hypothetical protein